MYQVKDAGLSVSQALPAAAATVNADPIDLRLNISGAVFLADCELLVSAPELTDARLGSGHKMQYDVECADDSDFSAGVRTLAEKILEQAGDGDGADAKTVRYRVPTDTGRYLRVNATADNANDASDASYTVDLLF